MSQGLFIALTATLFDYLAPLLVVALVAFLQIFRIVLNSLLILFFVFYYFMNFLCIIEGKDLTDVGSILMQVFLHAGYIPEAFLEKELG